MAKAKEGEEMIQESIQGSGQGNDKKSRQDKFVEYVITRAGKSKRDAAALSRAESPDKEHYCWEILACFGVDLEKPWERRTYAIIGSALSKKKAKQNGDIPFGAALRMAFSDKEGVDKPSSSAESRLRRILSSIDAQDFIETLRPILTLIGKKVSPPINYARLLKQANAYHFDPDRVKSQIANEFYRWKKGTSENEGECENQT